METESIVIEDNNDLSLVLLLPTHVAVKRVKYPLASCKLCGIFARF